MFLSGRKINITEVKELDIAKAFTLKYGYPITFSVVPFDTEGKREALINYLQWFIDLDRRYNGYIVRDIYYTEIYEGAVSTELMKQIVDLIDRNTEAFRLYDTLRDNILARMESH